MASEGGNQALVLDLLVDIADESAAGHVAAGDLLDGLVGDILDGAVDNIALCKAPPLVTFLYPIA